MNKRLILTTAMVLGTWPVASAWAQASQSGQVAQVTTATATVASVAAQAQPAGVQELSLDGVVEAVRQATLSAQVPGAIVSLNVKAGDRVRAGQELLRIDASAAQQNVAGSTAQLAAAQAGLRVASQEMARQQQLFEKQYISQAALERAQAQLQAAQAQVQAQQAQTRAAQTQTGFFSVRAPFGGVVSHVPVTLGDMAMPGRPLVTLHDPAALRVSVAVPQSLVEGVRQQLQAVRYDIAGHTSAAAASVQLLPSVDPVTHTTQLRVNLPTGGQAVQGLVPGMFARVWVPAAPAATSLSGQDGRVFLPLHVIVRRAEMTGVYVLDAQGQPRLRQVRLGRSSGQTVEVLSGVSAGEQVVSSPATLGKNI